MDRLSNSTHNRNQLIMNHNLSHIDTINFFDLDLLTRTGVKSRIPKDLLNIVFEYAEDEKIIKIRNIIDKMADRLEGNYRIQSYHFPLQDGSIKITEEIANQRCAENNNIICAINVRVNDVIGRGRGHGMVTGTHSFQMFYQSYMGPYQLLGHLFNTETHLENNSWIRCLIRSCGYINVNEFIYYSQHCNIWKCNEQNLWFMSVERMMTYSRPRNRQEQSAFEYTSLLNKNSEKIYRMEDRRITEQDLEMNRLRSRFEAELEILGEFTRRIATANNIEEPEDHTFTDRILGYLRTLRSRYPGLSTRQIVEREVESTLILEQSPHLRERRGNERLPVVHYQIHIQGFLEYTITHLRRNTRNRVPIPRQTSEERRDYYIRISTRFNTREQEIGLILALLELHIERLNLYRRIPTHIVANPFRHLRNRLFAERGREDVVHRRLRYRRINRREPDEGDRVNRQNIRNRVNIRLPPNNENTGQFFRENFIRFFNFEYNLGIQENNMPDAAN